MKWTDVDEIADALNAGHPLLDPVLIPYSDLLEMVVELDDFKDDPEIADDYTLESIHKAWVGRKLYET